MVNDFLFELGCEELPSAAVLALSTALAEKVAELFNKNGLAYDTIIPYAAPRRLALLVTQLADEQPKQTISRKGPAFSAAYNEEKHPTQALLGFARSCGVEVSDLTVVNTDKGDWFFYEASVPGKQTVQLLPAIIKEALSTLPIAKPMRWGNSDDLFVRPVHWLVMMYGEQIIDMTLFGVKSARFTFGHRFHHPEAISIERPDQYEPALLGGKVVPHFMKRRERIVEQIAPLVHSLNAKAVMSDALLDEVTSIVEWPQALIVKYDPVFLSVPKEALIASMQSHQKCFAVTDLQDQLLPYFITVSNLESLNPQQVIAGNEKVMRARLSDAAFFFEQDKKQLLEAFIAPTKNVLVQAKLGTIYDKTDRMQRAITALVKPLALNQDEAIRAAALSKCDLMTGMVGEFPELQGLMGRYYAVTSGETDAVAQALEQQYLPRFSGDDLPTSALGLALSLVDRFDTLVGTFSMGEKPTGMKDPFKLRRHALAVARLLIASPVSLSLSELIARASATYEGKLALEKSLLPELQPFILERLPAYYESQGFAADLIQAVIAKQSDYLDDMDKRVRALATFVQRPECVALSAACKRVNNILSAADLTDATPTLVDEQLFQDDAEKQLFAALTSMEVIVAKHHAVNDYTASLTVLADLREIVDLFFEKVMVMVTDLSIQKNRLALLQRLQHLLQGVADISLLSV